MIANDDAATFAFLSGSSRLVIDLIIVTRELALIVDVTTNSCGSDHFPEHNLCHFISDLKKLLDEKELLSPSFTFYKNLILFFLKEFISTVTLLYKMSQRWSPK